ncbi:LamG domain-containing protein [Cohnella silvisoli]|uniref:LamG domain-containing protein n=1 Tax=Cohnella silvisoli TaxID=2873699 RepID=A0ABV1L2Y8_9BACL|nr:LamG domain-containing protein [Cohnella silvisoli]MCD9025737.1 LamG domain-containing protein [Cohnella silvisoli]
MQRGFKTIGSAGINNNVGGLTNYFGDGSDGAFNPATVLSTGTTAPNGGTVANLWDGVGGTTFTTGSLSSASEQTLLTIDFGVNFNSYAYIQQFTLFLSTISTGAARNLVLYRSTDNATWVQVGTPQSITTSAANPFFSGINSTFRYWQIRLAAGGSTCTLTCQGIGINSTSQPTIWNITFPVTTHSGICIKQFSSLTLPSGYTMITDNPCRGLIIYCQGNADISGTIDMSQKAGLAPNGEMIPMLITKKAQYSAKTSTLLHFNNNTNDDQGRTWFNNGGAAYDATNKKFGSNAISFNGSTQYVSTNTSDDFSFGNEDFTIDFWARPTTMGTSAYLFGSFDASQTNGTLMVEKQTNDKLRLYYWLAGNASSFSVSGPTTLVVNTWYHIAVVRYRGVLTLYLNGVPEASVNVQGAIHRCDTGGFNIGNGGNLGVSYFAGQIDEFRVVKGKAMYTANFTPPTSEFTYTATYTDTPKTLEKYYQLTAVLQALRGGYGGNGGYGGGYSGSTGRQSSVGIGGGGRQNLGGFGGGGSGGANGLNAVVGGIGGSIEYAELGGGDVLPLTFTTSTSRDLDPIHTFNGAGGVGSGVASSAVTTSAGKGGKCRGGGGGGSGGHQATTSVNGNSGSDGQHAGGFIGLIINGNISINSSGVVKANGGNGGAGSASSVTTNSGGGGGGGGGSGGGVIAFYYKGTFTNNGTIQVNGGSGGSGGALFGAGEAGGSGTSGSVGTIHTQQIA